MDSNAYLNELTFDSDEDECNLTQTSDINDRPFWLYPMRRDMQEIIPGLFLGPYASAMKSKLEDLLKAGITHILCIRHSVEAKFIRPNFPQHFQYLVLEVADCPTENIIKHFKQTKEFIDDCLDNGGRVLVHGNGGLSRSAAIVIAYVMVKGTQTYREAYTYVRNRRFCISLNEGFIQQLLEYEHIYRAEVLFSCQPSVPSGKRKRLDLEMDSEQTFPK